jgi:hypothetical protein
LGRSLNLSILGKIIAKIADLGRKKAGLSSDFWENCMILKKISIGKRPFFGVCYISRKITNGHHRAELYLFCQWTKVLCENIKNRIK